MQNPSGQSFYRGNPEIPFRIVDRLAEAIVCIAHDSVGPVADELAGAAIAIAESSSSAPSSNPTSLRRSRGCAESGSSPCRCRRSASSKSAYAIPDVFPVARQVPGIVIAAVDHDALVAVHTVCVLMADSVDAGNHCSAALAVHEVDDLPDAVAPGVVANAKRAGGCPSPSEESIVSRLLDLGEIEKFIVSQSGLVLLDRPVSTRSFRVSASMSEKLLAVRPLATAVFVDPAV